jgi:3-phytase
MWSFAYCIILAENKHLHFISMFKIVFLLVLLTSQVAAQTVIFPFGSSWKFLDNGSDQATAWRATSFNDGTWKAGNGKFGYGISDAATSISFGPNAKKKYITTYFRKSISVTDISAYSSFTAAVKRDDGVVVYVNGTEIYRNNMPTGTITYTTLATDAKDNGTIPQTFTIPTSAFTIGTNVIAVEIHQQRANTPDMAFDLELIGNSSVNLPPTVSISSPTNGASFPLGQAVTITATASDPEGALAGVEFFANSVSLGHDATSPYSVSWTPTNTGSYSLTAIATDGAGNTGTSAPVSVTITQAPVTYYSLQVSTTGSGTVTKEPNQDTYAAGSEVKLTATSATGYQFTGWSGDASGSTNPLSLTMDRNKSITATFTAVSSQQRVESFTLINANNEQDLFTIEDGATINLPSLPSTKLNIRANTSPASVGSVKFELSGIQSKTYIDSAVPYALQGDDGNGNYYYGNWDPPAIGTYTLKATPYTGSKATGTAGMPFTITFTFTENGETPPTVSITPLFITEPLLHDADDPAIWINKENPAASLIIGTDKDADGALYVYNMEGKIINEKVVRNLQRPNNVDVGYGLSLGGQSIDVAVTSERYTGKLRIFSLPDMKAIDNGGIDVFVGETGTGYREPMGISLYKRPSDGMIYAIVGRKSGPRDGTYLWQYLLKDDGQGSVTGTLVRKFGNYSGRQEIEAVAVDDELGYVYYSDERVGVRKYFADPSKGNMELALFATTGFSADQEGIALYKIEDGTGYIIVADQDANEIHIYPREGTTTNPHDHQLVKVVKTSASFTDGIEMINYPIPPNFTKGVFVASSYNKYFHLYRWEDIAGNDLKVQPPQIALANNPPLMLSGGLSGLDNFFDQLKIYPNPVKKGEVITIKINGSEAVEIFVSDIMGNLLYSSKFTGTTAVETQRLAKGMYFISLSGYNQLKRHKILITD